MKKLCSIFLILTSIYAGANDGSFYASGNNLIPLQETDISLKKELLCFYIRDFNWVGIDINFEFFNPGPEKKLTVGFVTPPASGDVSDEEQEHPSINDFTVVVNGVELEYKIKRMKETSFASKAKVNGEDFVYYFDVVFKPGINTIKHTYYYKASTSVEVQRSFEYQVTTGKRWANKQIDDFELQVHLDAGIFYVPSTFWKTKKLIDWKIVGTGTIKKGTESHFSEAYDMHEKIRMVHLNSGYLSFKEKNFAPDYDINIGEYMWHSWSAKWCKDPKKCISGDQLQRISSYCSLKPYSDSTTAQELDLKELGILRNYAYALRGVAFKNKAYSDFYAQFFWYTPDPTIKPDDVKLKYEENKLIAQIKSLEEKKKTTK
ncbi:MAG TPA: YARHG domain-containing protein [Bacteroidia bacterium]